MPLAKHLTRREGTYYFRVRVPQSLTVALGKKEIAYSLRTKDPRTAKELSYIHSYNISRSFRDLESKLAVNPSLRLSQPLSYENIGKGVEHLSISPQIASKQEKRLARPTFTEIMRMYFKERKLPLASEADYIGFAKRLSKAVGDKPINEYTVDDFRNFKELLLDFPVAYFDIDKVNNLRTYLNSLHASKPNYKKITPLTVHKTIKGVSTIFNYAKSNGFITDNPASQIQVAVPKSSAPARLPFSSDELSKIFQSDFYQRPPSPKSITRTTDFRLLTLMAFFTGARMEELARLTLNDIGIEDGIHFIHIHGEENTSRRVKTASSYRRIPLPSRLIEMGFGTYVARLERRGEKQLFPSLFLTKEINGKVTHYFSRWFATLLDKLGITDKTKTFHSFRHTVKRLMREAGIEKAIVDCYQGHTTTDIASSYGRDEYNMGYSLSTLFTQLEKINYDIANLKGIELLC